jgi:predicted hotdog family 3-hydroxylacyl-ACP dehydratase
MMPRYFFDLRDGGNLSADDEGTELDGVEAARTELIQAFTAIAAQRIRDDGDRANFEMTVRVDGGREVLRASLSFTLAQV